MRARVAACAVLTGLALAAVASAAGGSVSHVVSVRGAVGPLRVDRSDRAQVIAYAGKPDVEAHGRYSTSRYDVLGYDCRHDAATGKHWQDYVVACRTAFYLVGGKLGLFFTYDKRYVEAHGVRIGMGTARVDRILHVVVKGGGCSERLGLDQLVIAFAGGNASGPEKPLVGGHVLGFFLHSRHHDPGVTDCD